MGRMVKTKRGRTRNKKGSGMRTEAIPRKMAMAKPRAGRAPRITLPFCRIMESFLF